MRPTVIRRAEHALPRNVEFADLLQECLHHWWSRRDRYDERRGASRKTFLRIVVGAKLLDLARGWKAENRGAGLRPLSLDTPISPDDLEGPTLAEMLPAQEDMGSDVAAVADWNKLIARLSDRQRRIIAGVSTGMTKTDLSRQFRISRDTLYEELKRIRQVFRDEGLAPHLE